MPETKSVNESKIILGKILAKTFEVSEDSTFDELLKKCDSIYSREDKLDNANELVTKLLKNAANTHVQLDD